MVSVVQTVMIRDPGGPAGVAARTIPPPGGQVGAVWHGAIPTPARCFILEPCRHRGNPSAAQVICQHCCSSAGCVCRLRPPVTSASPAGYVHQRGVPAGCADGCAGESAEVPGISRGAFPLRVGSTSVRQSADIPVDVDGC